MPASNIRDAINAGLARPGLAPELNAALRDMRRSAAHPADIDDDLTRALVFLRTPFAAWVEARGYAANGPDEALATVREFWDRSKPDGSPFIPETAAGNGVPDKTKIRGRLRLIKRDAACPAWLKTLLETVLRRDFQVYDNDDPIRAEYAAALATLANPPSLAALAQAEALIERARQILQENEL